MLTTGYWRLATVKRYISLMKINFLNLKVTTISWYPITSADKAFYVAGLGTNVIKLQNPRDLGIKSTNKDERVRPRNIHFIDGGTQVLISYLNHGLLLSSDCILFGRMSPLIIVNSCFDIVSGDTLWSMEPREGYPLMWVLESLSFNEAAMVDISASGSSALSPNEHRLLVHNLRNGLDLYRLDKNKFLCRSRTFKFNDKQPDKNYPVSVAFVHEGAGVVSGAQAGSVFVWETNSGEQFQVLEHDGKHILCVAWAVPLTPISGNTTQAVSVSNYFVLYNCAETFHQVLQTDLFSYIATASSQSGQEPYIYLWRAKRSEL